MSQEKPNKPDLPDLIYCQRDEEGNILKDEDGNPIRYDRVIFPSDRSFDRTLESLRRRVQVAKTERDKSQEVIDTSKGTYRERDEKEKLCKWEDELALLESQIKHLETGQNTVIDSTPLWQIRTKPE